MKSNSGKYINDQSFNFLQQCYTKLEKDTAILEDLHRDRLHCKRGCYQCCQDEITVFDIEADWIREHHEGLLRDELPAPHGMCAFLNDAGGCRIYEHRPYVCRTQGLPLQWFEEDDMGAMLVYRSICPLNEAGEPIEELEIEACWTLGEVESTLAAAQSKRGKELKRQGLRQLFKRDTPHRRDPLSEESLEV